MVIKVASKVLVCHNVHLIPEESSKAIQLSSTVVFPHFQSGPVMWAIRLSQFQIHKHYSCVDECHINDWKDEYIGLPAGCSSHDNH